MFKISVSFLFLSVWLLSCSNRQEVDLILYNAKVYTVDEDFSVHSALAVKHGLIVGVNSDQVILKSFASKRVIDVNQQSIYPGFIDAHCHFMGLGLNRQLVDLVGTQSFEEVLQRVDDFYKGKSVSVFRGRGWDQNDWNVKKFPSKEQLDLLYPTIPVVLERIDGHAYLVNQTALDLAGIKAGGVYNGGSVEEVDGNLTGILIDSPMVLIDKVIPKPTTEELTYALLEAQEEALSYGLTTVDDAGLDRRSIELIDSLQQVQQLKIRVYAMVQNDTNDLNYFLNKGIINKDRLYVGAVKVYGDGALGSRGAALKKPYSDKHSHYGAMITTEEELDKLSRKIAQTDYQMNTHAIGDSANVAVLRSYTKVISGSKNRRWRVEHAQVIDSVDFDYFKSGIIPSVQPTHATSDMYWAEERLGSNRIKGAYAYQTLLRKSGIIALGTDFPVEQVNPFLTFYAAVSRQDVNAYPKAGFALNEKLSREETLRGMTIWAAYANFQEKERGSIEIGKKADFVVVDRDILNVALMDIPKATVIATYIAGEQVYQLK